ncbi:MAG TPA: sodium:solute symporter family protein, partial [Candidatus Aminicenantes bacterium]|nr:sodium:solute symporter family protein [Candidatus Aminicenantes bacterium]
MNIYIILILCYLGFLTFINFWKSRQVKDREDMMLAGRKISVTKMVFTLICTWIGSGTFIAGAEFAAKAGWSALWLPAGAWIGIIIIYFLAAKIRTFGQYTVGDILEVRYGSLARIVGAIAIIISFTVIVSYQFKAGGYILNTISDGQISNAQGTFIAFLFVTIFTAIGGMIAVANTDLPNGIIILTSTILSTPLVIIAAGGWHKIKAILPPSHFQVFSQEFGGNPYLKIPAIGLSTLLLLLGVQSMYQKFYAARNPKEARKAAGLWVVGTIIIETVAVVIAVFAAAHFWNELQSGLMEPAAVIIQAAKRMIFMPVGILLLGAATAVVISTGMNYLLSPTTTMIHDIYLRYLRKNTERTAV